MRKTSSALLVAALVNGPFDLIAGFLGPALSVDGKTMFFEKYNDARTCSSAIRLLEFPGVDPRRGDIVACGRVAALGSSVEVTCR